MKPETSPELQEHSNNPKGFQMDDKSIDIAVTYKEVLVRPRKGSNHPFQRHMLPPYLLTGLNPLEMEYSKFELLAYECDWHMQSKYLWEATVTLINILNVALLRLEALQALVYLNKEESDLDSQTIQRLRVSIGFIIKSAYSISWSPKLYPITESSKSEYEGRLKRVFSQNGLSYNFFKRTNPAFRQALKVGSEKYLKKNSKKVNNGSSSK